MDLINHKCQCIPFASHRTVHTLACRCQTRVWGFGTDGWDIHPAAVLLNSMLISSHENKQCMTENVTSLWQPSSNKSIRLQMIHITESHSQRALLYLCSIRPAATWTDRVISWHRVFKTHTVEQRSIWVWQPRVWIRPVKASCWKYPDCILRVDCCSFNFSRRLKMWSTDQWENWFWTGHWKLQQSTCLPVTCWHLLSSEWNWKF